MALETRMADILKEQNLNQKELSSLLGLSQGYMSGILKGRNKNLSPSTAMLIEEKFGYATEWVLTGQTPKYKRRLSEEQKQLIAQVETLEENEVRAVLAFIRILGELRPPCQENGQK